MSFLVGCYVRAVIYRHTARGTTARHEARIFCSVQARPGPVLCGPGPARPDAPGRVWAAVQAHGLARHGTLFEDMPSVGPVTTLAY